jgi:hypothetical protein
MKHMAFRRSRLLRAQSSRWIGCSALAFVVPTLLWSEEAAAYSRAFIGVRGYAGGAMLLVRPSRMGLNCDPTQPDCSSVKDYDLGRGAFLGGKGLEIGGQLGRFIVSGSFELATVDPPDVQDGSIFVRGGWATNSSDLVPRALMLSMGLTATKLRRGDIVEVSGVSVGGALRQHMRAGRFASAYAELGVDLMVCTRWEAFDDGGGSLRPFALVAIFRLSVGLMPIDLTFGAYPLSDGDRARRRPPAVKPRFPAWVVHARSNTAGTEVGAVLGRVPLFWVDDHRAV